MSTVPNRVPPEVIFDRYFSGHPSPSLRQKYRGRLITVDFTDRILADAIEGIRDAINERFRANSSGITSPHGEPIIHMDYLRSDEVSAFAFFHEGIAFIALTSALLARLIDITSNLWRLNPLSDLLKVSLSSETRNYIAATSLPIQMQIVSSHELGHIFHGHCGESGHPGLRVDSASDLRVQPEGEADNMRSQAMEVEADGYAAHMMLTNFFNGIGENLYRMLNPDLPKQEFILTYFLVELGSLFYLWGPRIFDPQSARSYEHPPALMRMNVFMRDIEGWCSEHKPQLVHWGTLERFQQIMHCVSLANEETADLKVWQRQGAFLVSDAGEHYIADLYKTREKLRTDMDHLRWNLKPTNKADLT
jgi:hypothetical protein